MANYYHEARAEKRAIKEKTEANKRKAERRAELAGVEVGSWMHIPFLLADSCVVLAASDIVLCRMTSVLLDCTSGRTAVRPAARRRPVVQVVSE